MGINSNALRTILFVRVAFLMSIFRALRTASSGRGLTLGYCFLDGPDNQYDAANTHCNIEFLARREAQQFNSVLSEVIDDDSEETVSKEKATQYYATGRFNTSYQE